MSKSERKTVARKRAGTPKGRSGSSAKALRVAEQLLLAHTEPKAWIEYILKSGRGRWPEAESKMLQKDMSQAEVEVAMPLEILAEREAEKHLRMLTPLGRQRLVKSLMEGDAEGDSHGVA